MCRVPQRGTHAGGRPWIQRRPVVELIGEAGTGPGPRLGAVLLGLGAELLASARRELDHMQVGPIDLGHGARGHPNYDV